MHLSNMLRVAVDDDGRTLVSLHSWFRHMRFLGSNARTAAIPGQEVTSVAIYPEKDQKVLVALGGRYMEHGKHADSTLAWTGVWMWGSWEGGEFHIDLNKQMPPVHPARIFHSHIEVVIGDEEFSSDKEVSDGVRRVDGNVLCRYLAGDIDADEVRAAAEEAEEVRDRIAELEGRVASFNRLWMGEAERAERLVVEKDRLVSALERRKRLVSMVHEVASRGWLDHVATQQGARSPHYSRLAFIRTITAGQGEEQSS